LIYRACIKEVLAYPAVQAEAVARQAVQVMVATSSYLNALKQESHCQKNKKESL